MPEAEQVSTPPPLWVQIRRRRPTPRALLERFRMFAPPVDVVGMANEMGIDTLADPELPIDVAGTIHVYGGNDPRAFIIVRPSDAHTRQRFTVAHELGHLFLHSKEGDPYTARDRDFGGTLTERQANRFAADLLVPLDMLDPLVMKYGSSAVERLASIFNVSKEMMRFRLMKWGGSLRPWDANY